MTNSWNISGFIKAHGKRGAKYPVLWIKIELNPVNFYVVDSLNQETANPVEHRIDNNGVFLTVELNSSNTRDIRIGQELENTLDKDLFIFAEDCTVKQIKRSRKVNDEWESYLETGLAAKPRNIIISNNRFAVFNQGIVEGKVIKQYGTKVLVEERYRIPNKLNDDGTPAWGAREIPLLLINLKKEIVNKKIFALARLCGVDNTGKSGIYGVSSEYVVK
jgi:hypothetical protein